MRIHQRVQIDSNAPEASAACDRCQFIWLLRDLQWQYDYRGMQLQNTNFLVCPTCLDIPNPQIKPILLPPDPEPVLNPRVFNYTNAEVDYISEQDGDHIVEEDDDPIITQENGDAMLDDLYG